MTLGRVALLVGVAVLVLVANVAASIGYMVLYGHVIDPGHDAKYYNLLILLSVGMSLAVGVLFVVSFATKLVAALFGAKLRLARPAVPGVRS